MLGLFQVDTSNPALVQAQSRAFSQQIPVLYGILLANTFFVSVTHYRIAPLFLTVILPACFSMLAAARLLGWRRMSRVIPTHAEAARRLSSTVFLSVALGLAFTAWGISLFPYGDAYARSHVVFYMALTMIACVFCLMHLRAAATSRSGVAWGCRATASWAASRTTPTVVATARRSRMNIASTGPPDRVY